MKKTLYTLSLSAALIALFSASAHAAEKSAVYGVGRFAMQFADGSVVKSNGTEVGDFDLDNAGLDIGVGVKLNDMFRAEITYNYRGGGENEKTWLSSSSYIKETYTLTTSGVMLNGYIDIPTNSAVKPYIGAGVGFTNVEYELEYEVNGFHETDKVSSTEFSYNFAAGIGIEMNKQVTWDIGYRYTDYGSFKKNNVDFDTSASEVVVGVRYLF